MDEHHGPAMILFSLSSLSSSTSPPVDVPPTHRSAAADTESSPKWHLQGTMPSQWNTERVSRSIPGRVCISRPNSPAHGDLCAPHVLISLSNLRLTGLKCLEPIAVDVPHGPVVACNVVLDPPSPGSSLLANPRQPPRPPQAPGQAFGRNLAVLFHPSHRAQPEPQPLLRYASRLARSTTVDDQSPSNTR